MLKSYLQVFIVFCFTTKLLAQNFLLFPQNNGANLGTLSIKTCVSKSSEILSNFDPRDGQKAQELRDLATRLMNFGKHEYARDVFAQLLQMNEQSFGKNDERYLNSLVDYARIHLLLIQYQEAKEIYREALPLCKVLKGKDSWEYAYLLNESFVLYTRTGEVVMAKKNAKEIMRIVEHNGKRNDWLYAVPLNNMAACYLLQGELSKAQKYAEEALTLVQPSAFFRLNVAANVAEIYTKQGKIEEAKALIQTYYALGKNLKETQAKSDVIARIWLQYGNVFTQLKEFTAAKDCFKRAFAANSLSYSKDIEDLAAEADNLMFKNQFFATCAQAGTMKYSADLYKEIYENTSDEKALYDGYKVTQALLRFGDTMSNRYTSEANRLILFRLGLTKMLNLGMYYSYELYKKTGEQFYLSNAFKYAERSKSSILLGALQSKKSISYGNLPRELKTKEKNLQARLKDLQKQKLETYQPKRRAEIQIALNAVYTEINQFMLELKEEYPAYYKQHYKKSLKGIEEVQHDLIDESTILIEYALGEEGNYAFVLTKDAVDIIELTFEQVAFDRQVQILRRTLSDYHFINTEKATADKAFVEASSYLYDVLLKRILEGRTIQNRLLIIPDAELGHLPFEVFLSSQEFSIGEYASYPYLIKDYAVSYAYSANLLTEQNELTSKKTTKGAKGILALAAEYPPVEENQPLLANRSSSVTQVRKGLSPLPGAQKEVQLLQKYLYGEFFTDTSANEATFKQRAKEYDFIHLAMHGVLDSRAPILSSLVFSENGRGEEDNLLYAYEISQLDLRAKLVVLSACETGYGEFTKGEGIMSLAHSFTYAGAKSVLMSLWQVNDFSTGEIMKNYYTNISKKYTKDEALQKAKLAFIQENQAIAHPAYWAAFVQNGNTEALDLVCKSGFTISQSFMLMIGFFTIITLALIVFIYKKLSK